MRGLGKTTLAQLVYNDERVKQHFELKCWIYVSVNFQVKESLKGIVESIDKNECRLSQLDELQKRVQDMLRGKRFLIALDDIWIENSEKEKWEELSKTLSCGAEGSIVVMTTRSKSTSRMMAQLPELQHELGCLSQEDSWFLFKKLAFAEGREGGDITDLEPIGKQIVEKCKGLPLAVKTLGGLMWSKSSTRDWQRVMSSNIWELQESNILPALKLSYDNLPLHVKRCFAYCCMLPKGHEMGKDLLIPLWKANRLVPSTGETEWYVFGEEILNCLIWRSFFQVADNGYKMHDLMHDLARYVMGHDCSIIEPGTEFIVPPEVIHLSSSCPDFSSLQHDLEKLKSLRSVFIFAREYMGCVSHIFDRAYLRVLYLAGMELKTLPESIFKLKHLRYLNLSNSEIEVLPESIIYLQNLQVLVLIGCEKLRELPEGMRYIRNLQYLDISGCHLFWCVPESIIYLQNLQVLLLNCDVGYLPVGIGKLTSLRRLPYFRIHHVGAQIGELGNLNLLGPDLCLDGLENIGSLSEAEVANFKSKTHMLDLVLKWRSFSGGGDLGAHDKEVLERLEPNPSLEKLEVHGYIGKNISLSWIVKLKSLVQIHLYECHVCEHIPPLGKLPSLKVIELQRMLSLKCFHDDDMSGDDNTLFPKLKVLHLECCRDLICLPIQSFKDLNKLMIRACKNLRRRFAKDMGVDWPKISHIPNIDIGNIPSWLEDRR